MSTYSPNTPLLIGEGYFIPAASGNGNYYGTLYYNRDVNNADNSLITQQTGGFSPDFTFTAKIDEGVFDSYTNSAGRTIQWDFYRGRGIRPQWQYVGSGTGPSPGPGTGPTPTLGIATAGGYSAAGELTVITYTSNYTPVRPISYRLGYAAQNPNDYPNTPVTYDPWRPVTTWLANEPDKFRVAGLRAGFYLVQIRDSAATPLLSNVFQAELTTGAVSSAPCNLTLTNLVPTPPAAGTLDGGTVTGQLSNTQGLPVTVQLQQQGLVTNTLFLHDSALAAAGYRFTIPGVQPGLYNIVAGLNAQLSGTDGVLTADRCACFFPPPAKDPALVTVPPPDLEVGDQLIFLPWAQPALAYAATDNSLQISGQLTVDQGATTEDVATATARITGPGEVMGITQRAILSTTPYPDATGFSPLQLAAIEFKDEDLPWRYSTVKRPTYTPQFNGRDLPQLQAAPLPWLFLLVLKDNGQEYQTLPLTGPLPSIAVAASAPFPSPEVPPTRVAQQELWAHVQTTASLGSPGTPATATTAAIPPQPPTTTELSYFLNTTLPARPDLAYSRLLSPRRLEADTAYVAFLVPSLEVGRRAGLGLGTDGIDVQASAFPSGIPSAAISFPVYFQWRFQTGSEEDFESLVSQLGSAQGTTAAAAAPTLALATPGGVSTLALPALLTDPAAPPAPAAQAGALLPAARYLYDKLAPGFTLQRGTAPRPVVTPPLYGRAYMVQAQLQAPTSAQPIADSWKHQVNLDPRYRILAALGAQVVRDNQQEYVRRAWDQVQDILLANEKLRGAQYGLRTSAGLRAQHLPLATVTTTTTTAPAGGAAAPAPAATPHARVARADSAVAASTESVTGAEDADAATTTSTSVGMADYGLHLTGLSLGRVRLRDPFTASTATVPNPQLTAREALRRSSAPLAAFSPAFRRITKPFGNYVVSEAGRPLRPTQAEAPAPAQPTLREAGTSLAQRDVLLSGLIQGHLAAAPTRAEQARVRQFRDDRIDPLLQAFTTEAAERITLEGWDEDSPALASVRAAFAGFLTQGQRGEVEQRVGFRRPQYIRPTLPLPALLTAVVEGTAPESLFLRKIAQVSPGVVVPPAVPVPGGDFEYPDFNASQFYVGDGVEEPSRTLPADMDPADFSAADFQTVSHVVYDYEDSPPSDDASYAALATNTDDASQPAEISHRIVRTAVTSESTATAQGSATPASVITTTTSSATSSLAAPATDATLPAIKQAKVVPVFKDPMGEPLRQRHPELFVPGLSEFPLNGVAQLEVNQQFIEAYLVGLNHALGSELSWRGFPVDARGTFFQQFWDVSEHLSTNPTATEAAVLDVNPLDQWRYHPLGTNPLGAYAPSSSPTPPRLRLAVRSELLRRYPTLVLALQRTAVVATDPTAAATLLHPRQRLAVGQDLRIVTFEVTAAEARTDYSLLLLERPGQPRFGFDRDAPVPSTSTTTVTDTGTSTTTAPVTAPAADTDPLSWNDLAEPYLNALNLPAGRNLVFYPDAAATKPHAAAEPAEVAYLTDGARVAYALFQEPILASIPLSSILD